MNEMSNLHLCLLLSFFLDFSLATKDDTEDPIFLAEQSIVFFHSFYFRRKARLVFPVESYRPLDYSSSFLDDIVLQFRSNDSVDERIINLEANSFVRIRSINVPKSVAFAVVQAHSQVHRISMAQSKRFQIGNHVNGTSIGLRVDTSISNSGVMGYLINTQSINITVLVFVLYYDNSGE